MNVTHVSASVVPNTSLVNTQSDQMIINKNDQQHLNNTNNNNNNNGLNGNLVNEYVQSNQIINSSGLGQTSLTQPMQAQLQTNYNMSNLALNPSTTNMDNENDTNNNNSNLQFISDLKYQQQVQQQQQQQQNGQYITNMTRVQQLQTQQSQSQQLVQQLQQQVTSTPPVTAPFNSSLTGSATKENKQESRFRIVKTDADRNKTDMSTSSSTSISNGIINNNNNNNNSQSIVNMGNLISNASNIALNSNFVQTPIAINRQINGTSLNGINTSTYHRGRWCVTDYETSGTIDSQAQQVPQQILNSNQIAIGVNQASKPNIINSIPQQTTNLTDDLIKGSTNIQQTHFNPINTTVDSNFYSNSSTSVSATCPVPPPSSSNPSQSYSNQIIQPVVNKVQTSTNLINNQKPIIQSLPATTTNAAIPQTQMQQQQQQQQQQKPQAQTNVNLQMQSLPNDYASQGQQSLNNNASTSSSQQPLLTSNQSTTMIPNTVSVNSAQSIPVTNVSSKLSTVLNENTIPLQTQTNLLQNLDKMQQSQAQTQQQQQQQPINTVQVGIIGTNPSTNISTAQLHLINQVYPNPVNNQQSIIDTTTVQIPSDNNLNYVQNTNLVNGNDQQVAVGATGGGSGGMSVPIVNNNQTFISHSAPGGTGTINPASTSVSAPIATLSATQQPNSSTQNLNSLGTTSNSVSQASVSIANPATSYQQQQAQLQSQQSYEKLNVTSTNTNGTNGTYSQNSPKEQTQQPSTAQTNNIQNQSSSAVNNMPNQSSSYLNNSTVTPSNSNSTLSVSGGAGAGTLSSNLNIGSSSAIIDQTTAKINQLIADTTDISFEIDKKPMENDKGIKSRIELAMDLVKSHLTSAVNQEIVSLKTAIKQLTEKCNRLEQENQILKMHALPETLALLENRTLINQTQSSTSINSSTGTNVGSAPSTNNSSATTTTSNNSNIPNTINNDSNNSNLSSSSQANSIQSNYDSTQIDPSRVSTSVLPSLADSLQENTSTFNSVNEYNMINGNIQLNDQQQSGQLTLNQIESVNQLS